MQEHMQTMQESMKTMRGMGGPMMMGILAMVRGLTGLKGSRGRALLLLGFAGAFRRSELVGLSVGGLDFVDWGLIVRLRRSKTDQEGAGRKVGIPFARGKTHQSRLATVRLNHPPGAPPRARTGSELRPEGCLLYTSDAADE